MRAKRALAKACSPLKEMRREVAAGNGGHVELGHVGHGEEFYAAFVVENEDIFIGVEFVVGLQLASAGEIAGGIDVFDFEFIFTRKHHLLRGGF